jgi:hypothetical protein
MVFADTVLRATATGVSNSGLLPDDVTFSIVELDSEGEHADVSPPIVEFEPIEIFRDRSRNNERSGYVLNDDGERIGRTYEQWFTMEFRADVSVAARTDFDERTLHRRLLDALSVFDSHTLDEPLPDPRNNDQEYLADVHSLSVLRTQPNNQLQSSPAVRGSRTRSQVLFQHELDETELTGSTDPIRTVARDITVN